MSSKPKLYYIIESPVCRTVIAVGNILNIDFELNRVDLLNKEQLKPEYLKLNPFHQVPTFIDHDGFLLTESRAIAKYLFETRQPDHQFYPRNNLKRRAQIDRWLFYDSGTFFPSTHHPLHERMYHGNKDEKSLKQAYETMKTLDNVLGDPEQVGKGKFLVDNELSLADISLYFSANLFESVPAYNLDDYPNFKLWYNNVANALKQYDPDGLFPKAIESKRQFVEMIWNR